ncbi:Fructose-bisphosphate aldolase C [Picochlorum sp. SENEW3]|nr:Fructose-bisphosphate aldolase C [Picochlorum sp. SENEW3]WPT17313.1 Fructose-bisphosphate aldolase C [Picochlorum sp. SENEW3]
MKFCMPCKARHLATPGKGIPASAKSPLTAAKRLDTLADTKYKHYKNQGAVFAKWRAAIRIRTLAVGGYNAVWRSTQFAEYAQICHQSGIIEPELLIHGDF